MNLNIPTNQGGSENVQKEKQTDSDTHYESLDKEYIDKRSVTISLVHNYSNYRKVNMKVLGQRKETIGSSVSSCRVLASHKGEVEAYFPHLLVFLLIILILLLVLKLGLVIFNS